MKTRNTTYPYPGSARLVVVAAADIEALEAEIEVHKRSLNQANRRREVLEDVIEDLRSRSEYYANAMSHCNVVYNRAAHALHSIYGVLDGVEWTADSCAEIAQILEHAGYTIHAPGEPEGLVHGDNGEGHA